MVSNPMTQSIRGTICHLLLKSNLTRKNEGNIIITKFDVVEPIAFEMLIMLSTNKVHTKSII